MIRPTNSKHLIYYKSFGQKDKVLHVYIIQEQEFIRLNEKLIKSEKLKIALNPLNCCILTYKDSIPVERAIKKRFK